MQPKKQAVEGDFMADLAARKKATLTLADGCAVTGYSFGAETPIAGEVTAVRPVTVAFLRGSLQPRR